MWGGGGGGGAGGGAWEKESREGGGPWEKESREGKGVGVGTEVLRKRGIGCGVG